MPNGIQLKVNLIFETMFVQIIEKKDQTLERQKKSTNKSHLEWSHWRCYVGFRRENKIKLSSSILVHKNFKNTM